jgi:uncharacterized protein (TIGR02246 family)
MILPFIMASGASADETQEAEALGRLNEAYVQAFNAQNPHKVAEAFTAEADYVILTGDILDGRDAISQGHQSFFNNNPRAKLMGKQPQAEVR